MRMKAEMFLLAIAIMLLSACAQLGIPKPETFNERLAVGYSTVTAVRQTATTLLQAKKISADDAQNVQNQADNARAGLDIARTISKTDLKAADAKLNAVHTALTALQSYLATKK